MTPGKQNVQTSCLNDKLEFKFISVWVGGGGGWVLFEAWRLFTFSAFIMSAYSRWVLIRGWELIPNKYGS